MKKGIAVLGLLTAFHCFLFLQAGGADIQLKANSGARAEQLLPPDARFDLDAIKANSYHRSIDSIVLAAKAGLAVC